MAILITGSSGFIARHLIPELASRGSSVVGIDRYPPRTAFGDNFTYVQGSILESGKVDSAMQGVDAVVHLAAEHQDFGVPLERFKEVNVDGTRALLESAASHMVSCFVYFSSVAVYGKAAEPSHEKLVPSPRTPYGRSKLAAERLVEQWVHDGMNRRALILRPTVIHGPENYANMYRLVSQIARGRYLQVGRGDNIKSIGYVSNLVKATIFLMERMQPGVDIYNYSDEPHLTSRQIAATIADALGRRIPTVAIPRILALTLALPLDLLAAVTDWNSPVTAQRIWKYTASTHHSAAKLAAAGFTTEYSSMEGLQMMAQWYASSGVSEE